MYSWGPFINRKDNSCKHKSWRDLLAHITGKYIIRIGFSASLIQRLNDITKDLVSFHLSMPTLEPITVVKRTGSGWLALENQVYPWRVNLSQTLWLLDNGERWVYKGQSRHYYEGWIETRWPSHECPLQLSVLGGGELYRGHWTWSSEGHWQFSVEKETVPAAVSGVGSGSEEV